MGSEYSMVEAILRGEVLIATVLTLGLLVTALLKKEELTSDAARRNLKKNMRLFWITMLALFIPLLLYISSEVIDFMGAMEMYGGQMLNLEFLAENLEVATFFILNIGLMLSYYVFIRIRRQVDGHP